MEEMVLSRWGLLGFAVFVALTFGPHLLDRLTAWAVKHAENEDRANDKMESAFFEQLRAERDERKLSFETVGTLATALAQHTIALERHTQKLEDNNVLLRDFLERFRLVMNRQSQEKNS